MTLRKTVVLCSVAVLLVNGVARAQKTGQKVPGTVQKSAPKPPSYPQLFPISTNNNGYEEWVRAADLIQNNAKVQELLDQPSPSLAMKRRILDDPEVTQALQLVRAGVNKPVFSPRTSLDENTPLPELAHFRQLARLLAMEQYVAFADGRVDAAINDLRVGLAFGYRIQTDTLISGLVGVAIHNIVLKEFSQHLDQLSVYHCNEVRRIVEDFLDTENPAVHLLALEKGYALKMLDARRSDPEGLLALLKTVGGASNPDEDANVAAVHAYLTNHPGDANALLDEASSRISALYDQALLNLRLPPTQRKPLLIDQAASPGAALFRAVTVDPQQILDKYTRDQTQLRLLGVHVLIHRYRWDHNNLPDSLSEMRAPNLVKDVSSGAEVVYQREGDRYLLNSQTPTKRNVGP
ncbi:MAG: hypothetical protein JWN14_2020 [Chthonomonadales bacterium]|nr:hypothetical protein [Chthonomonadales bacterium]